MKKLILIFSLLILSACATQPDIVVPPGLVKPIVLDPRFFELCSKLDKLSEKATFDEILLIAINNIQLYGICADKQRVSTELIRELSNKKD